MKLKEILETPGCLVLNDWLMLNYGQTLEEVLPQSGGDDEEEVPDYRSRPSRVDKENYLNGYCVALRRYAWWKDGTQYVGGGTMTLSEALDAIQKEVRS